VTSGTGTTLRASQRDGHGGGVARRLPHLSNLPFDPPPEPIGTMSGMTEERIWTAEELERMTPEERQSLFDERVVTDLSQLDPEFLARVRARGRALLEDRGFVARQGDGG
jgi:hypothetical protein